MASVPVSRRERHRVETRDEAKRLALAQLAESGWSGPCALSLTAIARQMGITGPALYRYFAGRDELLAELAGDACEDLADAVHAAARQPGPPRVRVRAVATAYRDWALSQPHRYRLLFGAGTSPDLGTEPAARRTVAALLAALTGSAPPGGRIADRPPGGSHFALERLGATAWTRWHGVLSLQIDGHLGALGTDPGLAFQIEVDSVADDAERLAAAAGPGPNRPSTG
ncbi:MAG TPA: TetR/AcrR family transcriptional regulator [Mycobacteriales bacterium]|nr:TetR/AcrR family transcriptional regulator [Mycobacteriales bacterium]